MYASAAHERDPAPPVGMKRILQAVTDLAPAKGSLFGQMLDGLRQRSRQASRPSPSRRPESSVAVGRKNSDRVFTQHAASPTAGHARLLQRRNDSGDRLGSEYKQCLFYLSGEVKASVGSRPAVGSKGPDRVVPFSDEHGVPQPQNVAAPPLRMNRRSAPVPLGHLRVPPARRGEGRGALVSNHKDLDVD